MNPMGTVIAGIPVWGAICWRLSPAGLDKSPCSLGGLLHVGKMNACIFTFLIALRTVSMSCLFEGVSYTSPHLRSSARRLLSLDSVSSVNASSCILCWSVWMGAFSPKLLRYLLRSVLKVLHQMFSVSLSRSGIVNGSIMVAPRGSKSFIALLKSALISGSAVGFSV